MNNAETIPLVYLDRAGIELFAGPLESAIMRAIWRGKRRSPDIWRAMRAEYETDRTNDVAYTSVTSTLTRLVKTGLLRRTGSKGMYTYECVYESETAFVRAAIRKTLWSFLRNYADDTKYVLLSLSQGDRNDQ